MTCGHKGLILTTFSNEIQVKTFRFMIFQIQVSMIEVSMIKKKEKLVQ